MFESSFRNRNLFGGAELFTLSFEAGLQVPVSGGVSGGNSFEFGTHGELDLPEIRCSVRGPKRLQRLCAKDTNRAWRKRAPRLLYDQLFSIDASFGYDWKESINTEEEFQPALHHVCTSDESNPGLR